MKQKLAHLTFLGTMTLVAASLLLSIGCSRESTLETPSIDTARPAKIISAGVAAASARTYPGRVQAAQRVSLSFRVGGPVTEILVGKGQRVASGDVLARLDPRDYVVQVKNLEAQIAAARAQHTQAGEEYQRVRALYEHDNASRSDFDRARAAVDVSQAQLEATEQALEAARLAVADTELKAPYAGTVADRLVEAHQTVAPGQSVLRFQDVRGMEVVIDVPEREVSQLTGKAPRAIMVHFDAVSGDEEFPARVKEFATETDPQTRTFPVTLQLDRQPTGDLLPGMTASVRWLTGNGSSDRAAMVVPLAAVFSDETGTSFVWRVEPETMRVSRVSVTTGGLTESGLEVLSGLDPSDQVLGAGVHFVTEGQKVQPMDSGTKG